MVRKYVKKLGNPYMKRSRLSEDQFLAIISGYFSLRTATDVEVFFRENVDGLFKDWEPKLSPISRNTINRVFNKLDERVSLLVESGCFNDFPYGLKEIDDIEKIDVEINKIISQLYLLLTDQITKENLQELHDFWRDKGQGFFHDSAIWYGTETMWKKMSGLDHNSLRKLFNRICLIYFFYDLYKKETVTDATNALVEFLLNHLKENPLD